MKHFKANEPKPCTKQRVAAKAFLSAFVRVHISAVLSAPPTLQIKQHVKFARLVSMKKLQQVMPWTLLRLYAQVFWADWLLLQGRAAILFPWIFNVLLMSLKYGPEGIMGKHLSPRGTSCVWSVIMVQWFCIKLTLFWGSNSFGREYFMVDISKLSFDQSNPSSSSCKSVSSQINVHSEIKIHKGTSLSVFSYLLLIFFFVASVKYCYRPFLALYL